MLWIMPGIGPFRCPKLNKWSELSVVSMFVYSFFSHFAKEPAMEANGSLHLLGEQIAQPITLIQKV
jgi:hypothetical protein